MSFSQFIWSPRLQLATLGYPSLNEEQLKLVNNLPAGVWWHRCPSHGLLLTLVSSAKFTACIHYMAKIPSYCLSHRQKGCTSVLALYMMTFILWNKQVITHSRTNRCGIGILPKHLPCALGSSLARQFFSNQIRVRILLNKFSPTIQDHINLLLAFGALHFIEQRTNLPITYFNLSPLFYVL